MSAPYEYHAANRATTGANTDHFSTDITPKIGVPSKLVIFVRPGTDSVVNVMVNDGTNDDPAGAEESATLAAGNGYTFEVPTYPDYTYNLQFETAQASAAVAYVQEIPLQ